MKVPVEDLVNEVPNPPQDLMASERRDLETVRRWVDWILMGVDRLNGRFFVDSDVAPFVRDLALQNAFLACAFCSRGAAEMGKASLVHAWIDSSTSIGLNDEKLRNSRNGWEDQDPGRWHIGHENLGPTGPHAPISATHQDSELLAIFNAAVAERLLAHGAEWQGRQALRDLIVRLGLSRDELAAMLQIAVDILGSWESGRTAIPSDKLAQLQAASRALSRLLSVFQPERLPQVIRRPADLFDGQTAVDWIVGGRITDVAERYESLLAYQA